MWVTRVSERHCVTTQHIIVTSQYSTFWCFHGKVHSNKRFQYCKLWCQGHSAQPEEKPTSCCRNWQHLNTLYSRVARSYVHRPQIVPFSSSGPFSRRISCSIWFLGNQHIHLMPIHLGLVAASHFRLNQTEPLPCSFLSVLPSIKSQFLSPCLSVTLPALNVEASRRICDSFSNNIFWPYQWFDSLSWVSRIPTIWRLVPLECGLQLCIWPDWSGWSP